MLFGAYCENICDKLEALLQSQGVQLPARTSIQDVAAHLHEDIENLDFLQNMYNSLVEQGSQSQYFIQAVEYVLQFVAGG